MSLNTRPKRIEACRSEIDLAIATLRDAVAGVETQQAALNQAVSPFKVALAQAEGIESQARSALQKAFYKLDSESKR